MLCALYPKISFLLYCGFAVEFIDEVGSHLIKKFWASIPIFYCVIIPCEVDSFVVL